MNILLAFFVLGSLLLWFIIGSKGRWSLKALVIAFVLYSCLSINISIDNLFGWPSAQSLPESFHVHWIKIKEPNKRTGEKGSIYVWATNTGSYNKKSWDDGWDGWRGLFISLQNYDPTEPRAYRLSYSQELHKISQEALDKLRKGIMVGGRNRGKGKGKGKGKGDGKGKGGGKDKGGGKGGGSLSNSDDIIFHDLPPSKLPDKVTE